jgi:hypothetical protein
MGLVDHNLNNLRDQEKARVKMFINRKISSQMSQKSEAIDIVLQDLQLTKEG